MNAMEVLLVVLGVGAYAASFIIPEKGGKKETTPLSEKEVRSISRLCSDGSYEKVEFSAINNCYTLHIEAYPFDPIVLIIDN